MSDQEVQWRLAYRQAMGGDARATVEVQRAMRDAAIVDCFRGTSGRSLHVRAVETLRILGVSTGSPGRTRGALSPQRVVQVARAYHLAEVIGQVETGTVPLHHDLRTVLASELTIALTEAQKWLGGAGAQRLAHELSEILEPLKGDALMRAAESAVRDAIAQAKQERSASVQVSRALDTIESNIASLDAQQQAELASRLANISRRLG